MADEALGNVRTVRAFAMEATETRRVDSPRISSIHVLLFSHIYSLSVVYLFIETLLSNR